MTHLAAIAALVLGPILWLLAVPGEMANLLTVAARDRVRVTGLVALLGYVICRTTVATGTGSDVRTL